MRLALLSFWMLACGPSKPEMRLDVIRMGQLRMSLPPDCKVEFLDAPPAAAMLLLTQVGMISAQVPAGHIDEALRDEVRKRACGLGGDVITFNVGLNNGATDIVQFLVFKKPPEEPKPKPSTDQTSS
jgi:hypothetical protein